MHNRIIISYMNNKNTSYQIKTFQGLRALAFGGIFLSHMKIGYFVGTGAWGVSIFLMLSGFLMFKNYYLQKRIKRISIKDNFLFSLRKVKRLYPLHIIMMITAIPLMIYNYTSASEDHLLLRYTVNVIANVCLIQSWFPKEKIYYSLNGVAWYLSVCVFLYFLFPYVLRAIEHKYTRKKAITNIIVIIILQLVIGAISSFLPLPWAIRWDFPTWATYILPLSRFGDFIIGCNLGYLYISGNKKIATKKILLIMLALFAIALSIWNCALFYFVSQKTNVPAIKWWTNTSLFVVSSMLMIYVATYSDNLFSRILSSKIFIFIGNISAYLFLIHQMVFKYFEFLFKSIAKKEYVATWYYTLIIFTISVILAIITDKTISLSNKKNIDLSARIKSKSKTF